MNNDSIDRLVNVWINGMLSVSNDAGWGGESVWSMFMDYGQYVSSGYDKSNTAMINAISMLRKEHSDFRMIHAVMQELMADSFPVAKAIFAKNYYRGLNPATEKPWTDSEKAAAAGMTRNMYNHHLSAAYDKLKREIQKFKRYAISV